MVGAGGDIINWGMVGSTGTGLDPETEYVVTGGGISVPKDGCYLVHWTSGDWGISYFNQSTIAGEIIKNSTTITSASNSPTGFIAILGPWLYYTPPVTNLWDIVEAKKGDIFSCFERATGFTECYGWIGPPLRGMFAMGITTLTIQLVAEADNVKLRPTPDIGSAP
jgi:hypothetical protein